MHLAAAAGVPTLGLFGPTPSEEYAPAGINAAAVVSTSTLMQDLSVEAAVAAAARLVAIEHAAECCSRRVASSTQA